MEQMYRYAYLDFMVLDLNLFYRKSFFSISKKWAFLIAQVKLRELESYEKYIPKF